jgi:hypothetical protein
MIQIEICNRLLDEGFSLLTVGESKVPNFSWKPNQIKSLSKEEFEKRYNYKGGIKLKSGGEMLPTNNVGLITGYDFLECIDVDLKVFSTAKEQLQFWDEYLSFLQDNILDFEEKFVVYKTKNNGYHILYKSKRLDGNKKIAVLKGHKEAVIESRGNGGYVFIYENNVFKNTYKDIEFITDEDREILWTISKSYNYKDEKIEIPKKVINQYDNDKLKSWQDYNNKTSILDIINDDFDVVRNLKDRYIIKRKGSDNVSSGSVFKNSGCMYIFTTGSIYPFEKLVDPFTAYTYKKHNGDFLNAGKELYEQGFGERQKIIPILEKVIVDIKTENLTFPLEVFPEEIQKYILLCNKTLNSSIDYMGCSMLWLNSIIIGNSINIEVKKGWVETANIWIALVGKAGIGKTPSISNITFPIMKRNSKEIKNYIKKYDDFEKYKSLEKSEQNLQEEKKKPSKTQFIVNDVTLEALVEMHGENKNGIGVLKDELAGWFKDMNKYRQGSDTEHWLSSWSGKEINMNRKTAKSAFVEKAFIPVLGGIQPGIMDSFYTEENKDNGFIDRMLFSFPELTVEEYNDDEMKDEYLNWYDNYIIGCYETIQNIIEYTDDFEIMPHKAKFNNDAKDEWKRIFNDLTGVQNSDNENEYMKSMLPKQKSYIPRFALILNTLNSFSDKEKPFTEITKKSVLDAEKLSNYFIEMSKKIKVNSIESKDIKTVLSKNEGKSNYDKFISIYSQDENINKSKLADILGVSRTQIYSYIKKQKDEK